MFGGATDPGYPKIVSWYQKQQLEGYEAQMVKKSGTGSAVIFIALHKLISIRCKRRAAERNQELCQDWLMQMAMFDASQLLFVDESAAESVVSITRQLKPLGRFRSIDPVYKANERTSVASKVEKARYGDDRRKDERSMVMNYRRQPDNPDNLYAGDFVAT
jgi:hypothetical protein